MEITSRNKYLLSVHEIGFFIKCRFIKILFINPYPGKNINFHIIPFTIGGIAHGIMTRAVSTGLILDFTFKTRPVITLNTNPIIITITKISTLLYKAL